MGVGSRRRTLNSAFAHRRWHSGHSGRGSDIIRSRLNCELLSVFTRACETGGIVSAVSVIATLVRTHLQAVLRQGAEHEPSAARCPSHLTEVIVHTLQEGGAVRTVGPGRTGEILLVADLARL